MGLQYNLLIVWDLFVINCLMKINLVVIFPFTKAFLDFGGEKKSLYCLVLPACMHVWIDLLFSPSPFNLAILGFGLQWDKHIIVHKYESSAMPGHRQANYWWLLRLFIFRSYESWPFWFRYKLNDNDVTLLDISVR